MRTAVLNIAAAFKSTIHYRYVLDLFWIIQEQEESATQESRKSADA
jgi:hypothetical protein